MSRPLPGVPWTPSNGTEGSAFHACWCGRCARDKVMNGEIDLHEAGAEDLCEFLKESYLHGGTDRWRRTEEGVLCAEFVALGNPIPERDEFTLDLFPELSAGDGGVAQGTNRTTSGAIGNP